MNVVKIGGSTLRRQEDFERLVKQLRTEHSPPTVVVISALPLVTRHLESAARLAEQRQLQSAIDTLSRVVEHHHTLADILLHDASAKGTLRELICSLSELAERLLRGVSLTGELTLRTLDRIVSIGERLALHLVHHVLQQWGLSVAVLPAAELIVTDDTFGNANPIESAIAERVRHRLIPLFESVEYVLTEGFVGATCDGETTTMGKESSTLTAALLASVCRARELVLYTPMAGIFSADPLEVPSAQLLPHLHYDDAERLARAGLKLLFPTMIAPLRTAHCRLRIRSLDADRNQGTRIDSQSDGTHAFVVMSDVLERATFLPTIATEDVLELRSTTKPVTLLESAGRMYVVSRFRTLTGFGETAQWHKCQYVRAWARWRDPERCRELAALVANLPDLEVMVVERTSRDVLAWAITLTSAPLLPRLHEELERLVT
jgi:aspartate kinase